MLGKHSFSTRIGIPLLVTLSGACLDQAEPTSHIEEPAGFVHVREASVSVMFVSALGEDVPASVEADALMLASIFTGTSSLEAVTWELSDTVQPENAVIIEYRGDADFISADVQTIPDGGPLLETEKSPESEASHAEFTGVNFVSHHQFTIRIPKGVLSEFAPPSSDDGDETDYGAGDDDQVAPEVDPSQTPRGWSYNFDDRQRRYGLNGNVGGVNRWQTQIGGGCSGALVGPRHVVTAAHCLYDFGTSSYYDDYNVRAGANGTAERAEVFIDDDATLPPGEFLWAFVPPGYVSTGQRQFDFGILVTPESIGGSGAGQAGCYAGQCWFGYVTYSKLNMKSKSYYRRGYPLCSWGSRIDEPCQTGTWASYQSCSATPCNPSAETIQHSV